ncbi:histidinol-phosphate transaminase [candidate division NPL-UPA2 bacterium]|nr:histidinol-phosphate transaminase [candidate division NPL-UPA2 bacterium]
MKPLTRENIREIEPYPPGKPIKEVERELGIEEAIKLASNENPLGPSPGAVEAMKQALHEVNLYPDGNSYYLKKSLAAHLVVKEESLILGNGSDEIIRMIAETFLNEGEEAIVGDPAFLIYRLATQIMKGRCRLVALKNFTHDLTAMAGMISERTKLIFIANPNNPTGTMVTAKEVDAFMKKVPEEVIVIFDEAYYEYIERDDFPQTVNYIREGRRMITLRTFSKIYGLAGLRIGYGIGPKELIKDMNRVRQPFNTNSLAQVAALAALADQEHVEKSRKANREGKDFLYGELEKLKISYIPSQANFVLINVREEGKVVSGKLMQKGIIVRPMGMYGLPHSIRVTVGTEEQNKVFIKALQMIA